MSKYSKESLDKLLLLIEEISREDENLWFLEELKNKYSINYDLNNSEIKLKLNLIENYLKIDGIEIIDYSEIKNDAVKNQLTRDCIEMSKYRLGKINDTINFEEYCRYAHMQTEELLNYYYQTKYNSVEDIVEFIKHYGDYKPSSSPRNIHTIGHAFKLNAFTKSNGLDKKLKYYLDFASKIRNEISHRNSFQIDDENKIIDSIYLKGLKLEEYQDLKILSKSDLVLYFKAKVISEKRKQDFKSIMIYLDYLKQAVVILLK
jgi:hypothetical protein